MQSAIYRPGFRAIPGSLIALALLLILAVPAHADGQTATDAADLKQTTIAQAGNTAADSTSAAISGATTALGQTQIHQINIQVIAGPKSTRDNATQTATNTATVEQNTIAWSGDATAAHGGIAISGNAHARSLAIVHQMNIQIIAGHIPSGGVTQTASNTATVDQTTAAGSGDAAAGGGGSTATSGDASASSVAVVQQRNFQLFVGKGPSVSDDPVKQTATNSATIDQTTMAVSGTAMAVKGSEAASGDVKASAKAIVTQANRQVVR